MIIGLSQDPVAFRLAEDIFAFRDGEEIGPRMLSRIARRTGLSPDDL